jgi:hypothetical protein
MEIFVIGPLAGYAMDEPWVAVKSKNDGLSLVIARRNPCRSIRGDARRLQRSDPGKKRQHHA